MTKQEAIREFKELYPEVLKSTDKPLKNLTWAMYTDSLCKDGRITQKQFDSWDNPPFAKIK